MYGKSFFVADRALVEDPVRHAVRLAAALNCSVPRNMRRDHGDIVACLRTRSAAQLVEFQVKHAQRTKFIHFFRKLGSRGDFSDNAFKQKKKSSMNFGDYQARGSDRPSFHSTKVPPKNGP